VEKPDEETAVGFINEGCYLWNSGIFAWNASVILAEIGSFLPDLGAALERIRPFLGTMQEEDALGMEYPKMPKISVDYGVMEKSRHRYVIPVSFGWDDVGTWVAAARHYLRLTTDPRNELAASKEGDGWPVKKPSVSAENAGESATDEPGGDNLVWQIEQGQGRAVLMDCSGCIVLPSGRLVAGIGLKDLIVVDTPDALLICTKRDEQRIKHLLNRLKVEGLDEYL